MSVLFVVLNIAKEDYAQPIRRLNSALPTSPSKSSMLTALLFPPYSLW